MSRNREPDKRGYGQTLATQQKLTRSQTNETYPKTGPLVFGLFLFYVLYKYLEIGYRISVLGSIRFELILGLVLSIVAVSSYLPRKDKVSTSLYAWTFMLFLCMGIMVVASINISVSSTIFLDRVIKFAMLALMIMAFVNNPRELKWFIGAFMLACMKLGQEGFLGTITGSMIWENQGIPRLHGSTPIYEHPNSLSGMAIGTLPFILYLFPYVSRWFKFALLVQIMFVLDIVLFTGSRTGYVAFVGGIGLAIKRSKHKWKALISTIILSLILVHEIPKDYIGRFDSIFTHHDKEGASTEARIQILEDAWEIFKEHPLGVGVHAFPIARAIRFGRTQDTHNLYFEVATNLGIQGLIVFTGFIIAMLKALNNLRLRLEKQIAQLTQARDLQSTHDPTALENHINDLTWIKSVAQAVYLFIFLRLILGLFGMDLYEIYWWFSLGLTIALMNIESCARKRTALFTATVPSITAVKTPRPILGRY